MCKVLMLTNTSKVLNFDRLVSVSAAALKTQRDGFGYAAFADDLKVFGERTNAVNEFKSVLEVPASGLEFTDESDEQNSFGEVKNGARAAIFHGRISTNNKALVNVHPILKNEWALIHNGVVSNHGSKYPMTTDNDSEHVLHNFSEGGIKAVSKNLTGYYAFGAFDGLGNLHIVRDSIAKLYACKVGSIDSIVYGTTKELIKEVCAAMGFHGLSSMSLIKNDTYIVHKLDGSYEWSKFDSRGRDEITDRFASLSLGHSLPSQPKSIEEYRAKWPALHATSQTAVVKYSSRERKDIQNEMIAECVVSHERLSLTNYFKFINSTKNTYYVLDSKGAQVPRKEFQAMSPVRQINFEVICAESHAVIDPYFEALPAMGFGQYL
jgi:hypothetical protein